MNKTYSGTICLLLMAGIHSALAADGPLTPEQAVASFHVDSGLKIECVVSEPTVISPVAVAWDEDGRMYVVEDTGYPVGPGKGKKPVGRVVLLESTKHDGHYDKRTVYTDGLTFPNGIMCWKGGVYVTCAPYLYYFKDTKGDGVADVKQVVFKGFQDLSTTQLRVSHPILNIDNWIYLTSGLTSAKVSSPLYTNHPVVFCNRTDFRFRPDTDQFEPTSGTAQFGQTFDNFGRKFVCSNRNHNEFVAMQLKYLNRNHDFSFSEVMEDIPDHGAASRVYPLSANITTAAMHAGYFTSACGIFYYRGAALPAEYQNNTFTCEPAGNLVHRDVISPTNSTFVAKRAAEGVEFLASPDDWFRPVNLAAGPDGAMYLCDMYRKTIEHPEYLPEATAKVTDFNIGKDKGRIYRISAQAAPKTKARWPNLSKASVKELCNTLNDPDAWWRSTAQRLLLERRDPKAVPLLRSLSAKAKMPETRVLAFRLLEGLGAINNKDILLALNDTDPGVRENALQISEPLLNREREIIPRVLQTAYDPNPRVRFQCALSIGEINDPEVLDALAYIAAKDINDHWTRAAVLTSVDHRAADLLHVLLAGKNKDNPNMAHMLVDLCHILGASEPLEKMSSLLNEVTASTAETDAPWQAAAITGMADGLRSRGLVKAGQSTLAALTGDNSSGVAETRARVNSLLQRSIKTAGDSSRPLEQRLVAIGLLAQADFSVSGKVLRELVAPEQPTEIQVAAIRGFGNMPDEAAAASLIRKESWTGYTPPVLNATLAVIMAKPALIQSLLTAIAKGDIPAWTINSDRQGQLKNNKDAGIKTQAMELFKEERGNDRKKAYEDSKAVLALTPDPKNGHLMFTKICSGCHVFGGEGHLVGPDLTGIRNQPKDVLLLHIIIPEYEIMPIYTCYNVETKDGQSLTGLLAGETPSSITLRQALAHEETIQRANITSMTASRLSLMPDGLENSMTKQELADLLGFLKGM